MITEMDVLDALGRLEETFGQLKGHRARAFARVLRRLDLNIRALDYAVSRVEESCMTWPSPDKLVAFAREWREPNPPMRQGYDRLADCRRQLAVEERILVHYQAEIGAEYFVRMAQLRVTELRGMIQRDEDFRAGHPHHFEEDLALDESGHNRLMDEARRRGVHHVSVGMPEILAGEV